MSNSIAVSQLYRPNKFVEVNAGIESGRDLGCLTSGRHCFSRIGKAKP